MSIVKNFGALIATVVLGACGGGLQTTNVPSETDLQTWKVFEKACISSNTKARDRYLKSAGWKVASSASHDLPLVSIAESRNFDRKTIKAYRAPNNDSVIVLGEYKSADATEASPACYLATSIKYGSIRFFDDKVKSYVFDDYKKEVGSFSKNVRISGGVNRTGWINEVETGTGSKRSVDVAGVSFISGDLGRSTPSLVLRVNR